jgi:hypothetical protein
MMVPPQNCSRIRLPGDWIEAQVCNVFSIGRGGCESDVSIDRDSTLRFSIGFADYQSGSCNISEAENQGFQVAYLKNCIS